MKKIALIIGFGSIGKQYYKVLKKLKIFKEIHIYSVHNKKKISFPNLIKFHT